MSITKLIQQLEKIKAEHGDLNVYYKDLAEGGSESVNTVAPEWPYKVVDGVMQWGVADKTRAPYGVEIG